MKKLKSSIISFLCKIDLHNWKEVKEDERIYPLIHECKTCKTRRIFYIWGYEFKKPDQ